MHIEIENIGILKEGRIDLSGLSIIAGENETGKSTVGRLLLSIIKSDNIARINYAKINQGIRDDNFSRRRMDIFINRIFNGSISLSGRSKLFLSDEEEYNVEIENDRCSIFNSPEYQVNRTFTDATLIETPLILNLIDFFDAILRFKEDTKMTYEEEFEFTYPYTLWDTYKKISTKVFNFGTANTLADDIGRIIQGKMKKIDNRLVFVRDDTTLPFDNMASGIKSFGVLQLLIDNNCMAKNRLLVVDEPETNLHPAWQLEYAKIIHKLACEYNVNILVSTHSPYIVELFKILSEKNTNDKISFHIAKKEGKHSVIKNVTSNIEEIYSTLSVPMQKLEAMKAYYEYRNA